MKLQRLILTVFTFCFVFGLSAQNKVVSGKVLDAKTGEPLTGVTVVNQTTKSGTITDLDGFFKISVPVTGTKITVSYVGYVSQTISTEGKSSIDVRLAQNTKALDEVVVVGFATQKKESVVGQISQVKGSDLMKAGVPSVANALAGRVPGMVTVQQSGLPGSNDAKIYIRGMSSFTGSSAPLILVDGIETNGMNDINPSEVENISVLKDASATAVFGVKGANGVILITTKRGQEGKMEIAVTYDQTLKQATTKSIQQNAYNTLMARNSLYRNRNSYNLVLSDQILNHYRDQDMPFIYPDIDTWNYNVKDFAIDTQASISARGGTKNAKYFLTLSYLHEGDIVKNSQTLYDPSYKYDRVNYRMNFDFNLTKSTTLSLSSGGYVGTDSHGGDYGVPAKVLSNMLVMPPYMTPYYYSADFVAAHPSDKFPIVGDRIAGSLLPASNRSSIEYIHNQQGTVRTIRDRLTTDLNLVQKLDFITKGLSAKLSINYNNESSWKGGGYTYYGDYYIFQQLGENSYEWLRYIYDQQDNYKLLERPYQTSFSQYQSPKKALVYSAQIDYNRSFEKHNISALGVFLRRNSQSGASFPHYEENWVGRATYDYDGRYLLEANIGVAGSEQFAPENRFGVFPAIAVGWNVAKEPLFKKYVSQINTLKFRGSYGVVGFDGTNGFLYVSDYSNSYSFKLGTAESQTSVSSVKEGDVPNPGASWEMAYKKSVGFDFGIFDNRFTMSVDFFDEFRDRILMSRGSVSDIFGQSMKSQNVGSVKKHGYEIELGYNDKIGELNYWMKGNFNFNENRVVSKDEPAFKLDYLKAEGKPIGTTLSSKNIGYYQDMDELMNYSLGQNNLVMGGDKVLDFNGDGTTNNDAVAMAFSNRPNYTYGFSAGFDYKNFDFNFLFQGVANVSKSFGNYTNPMWTYDPGDFYILLKDKNDAWSPDNRDAAYANWGGYNATSKGIVNASYLKLKSMELGYTLRGRMLKKLGLNSARLALQGSNLLTFAPGYILGDPENEGSVDSYGNDYSGSFQFYPLPRRFTLGVKVNF